MRRLNQFSAGEWLQLAPLAQALRQLRNDALLARYLQVRPAALDPFLADYRRQVAGADVALVIAFQQPWALDWQLGMAARNLPGVPVLVFDNSRDQAARTQIEEVCRRHGAPYLPLPPYRTRHVNRSHGMAMSWVFHNVVRVLQPRGFGYLDHDLIPVKPVDVTAKLAGQEAFGLRNGGNFEHWSLWAGYCFYRSEAVQGKPLNFLYDFSRGLDTGGRNWNALYSRLDPARLRFASQEFVEVRLPSGEGPRKVELIDGAWAHIGAAGYNDNFETKFAFFSALRCALEQGAAWEDLAIA